MGAGSQLYPQRHDNLRPRGADRLSGLEDLDFIPPEVDFVPPEVQSVRPNQVSAEEEALWDDFLETVEGFPDTSSCREGLVNVVHWYLSGTERVSEEELDRAARQALGKFFTNSVPLHGPAALAGRSGRGTITLEKAKTALIEVLGRQGTAEAVASACVELAVHQPRQLEKLVDECRPREAPAIFHYMYGANDQVKADLVRYLSALYDTYDEWDYAQLLRPID